MSLPVVVWVFEHSEEKLGNRLVLLTLAEFAHDDGSEAYPSVATIGKRARLSERQVRYCLRSLEESGAIVKDGKSDLRTTKYCVQMGAISAGANTAGGQNPPDRGGSPVPPNQELTLLTTKPSKEGFAQKLTARFVDMSRERGSDPPREIIKIIARNTKSLLEQDYAPEVVERAYALMLERGLHPSTLASCVQQTQLGGGRGKGGLSAQEIVDLGRRIA